MTDDDPVGKLIRLEKISQLAYGEAEQLLLSVLEPILSHDKYITTWPAPAAAGVDGIARREADSRFPAHTLALEFNFRRSPKRIDVADVLKLLGAAVAGRFDRAVLFSNEEFTDAARQLSNRELPAQLELVTLQDLRTWLDSLSASEHETRDIAKTLIREISRRFAEEIARDPTVLERLDWLDVERMLAEVFNGLGFKAELTRATKDGGKDIILEFRELGVQRTHIVEVKHWRSGKRVGSQMVTDFLHVIHRERRSGGLFLSSSGFTESAFEQLAEIDRRQLRFGDKNKIVALCRTYERHQGRLLSPPENLTEVVFEGTE